MRRNIYEGPRSCYGINEGVYVVGSGVDLPAAASIAYLILRDYARGWTYNHQCQRIPMTPYLFKQRLRYLYPLCIKHTGNSPECEKVKELIEYVIQNKALPRWAYPLLRIHGIEKVLIKVPAKIRRKAKIKTATYY